jgi:hydroxyquinol 1,2-dioxygenase
LEIGRQFLLKLAQPSQDFPMGEIHLMSDCLGLSELSVLLEDSGNHGTTEMNVEGPLYIGGLPERQSGDRLGEIGAGDKPMFVTHKVCDTNGNPLANAIVDVWQPNGEGHYYVQRDYLPEWNFYGRFHTDANGEVHFLTVVPGDYPVPTAGITGGLLHKLGRHGFRACHIHYMIQAPGHEPLTTMMYFNHSPYVDSDTIFSVKNFRVDITQHDDVGEIAAKGLDRPFYTLDYSFVVP